MTSHQRVHFFLQNQHAMLNPNFHVFLFILVHSYLCMEVEGASRYIAMPTITDCFYRISTTRSYFLFLVDTNVGNLKNSNQDMHA